MGQAVTSCSLLPWPVKPHQVDSDNAGRSERAAVVGDGDSQRASATGSEATALRRADNSVGQGVDNGRGEDGSGTGGEGSGWVSYVWRGWLRCVWPLPTAGIVGRRAPQRPAVVVARSGASCGRRSFGDGVAYDDRPTPTPGVHQRTGWGTVRSVPRCSGAGGRGVVRRAADRQGRGRASDGGALHGV